MTTGFTQVGSALSADGVRPEARVHIGHGCRSVSSCRRPGLLSMCYCRLITEVLVRYPGMSERIGRYSTMER